MRPLQHSYHNLGRWLVEKRDGEYHVIYDTAKTFQGGITIGAICLLLCVALWYCVRDDQMAWVIPVVGIGTVLAVVGIGSSFSDEKQKVGPIFKYQPAIDVAAFPQDGVVVPGAKQRLEFSYEIYRETGGDSNSELNYFIDDIRHPFLCATDHSGPLRKLADELEGLGLVVTGYDGLRKEPNQSSTA